MGSAQDLNGIGGYMLRFTGNWGSVTAGITEVIQIRHRETRSALEPSHTAQWIVLGPAVDRIIMFVWINIFRYLQWIDSREKTLGITEFLYL